MGRTYTFLLLLCSLLGIFGQTATGHNPVAFKKIGTIIFSGSHYIVPVSLNITSLLELCTPLEHLLTQTREDFNTLLESFSGKRTRPISMNISATLPTSMRDHITLLMNDLHSHVLNLKNS